MKKYFYTALALVAMVGCSKDSIETPSFDDSVQSIEISIENITTPTRAEGGITPAGAQTACADFSDLIFLFADSQGNIKAHKDLSDGNRDGNSNKVTFHRMSADIKKVGVIANYSGAESLSTLAAAEVAWKDETAMIDNPYRNINVVLDGSATTTTSYGVVAYGTDNLDDAGTCNHDGALYAKKSAEVTVAPHMARIEIEHIGYIDDFGTANDAFTAIGVRSLSLEGGNVTDASGKSTLAPYVHTLGSFHHSTEWSTASYVLSAKHDHSTKTNMLAPAGDGNVWSWSILPQKVSNLTTSLYLHYPNHEAVIHDRKVTINEYYKVVDNTSTKIDTFDSGNIYRFAIDFKKNNLDPEHTDDFICVDCTVSIANWVVNDITVDFVTGGNN